MHPSFNLTGRRALITGSSRGIGAALALGLAESGADIAIHHLADSTSAAALADRVRALGRRSAVIEADLAADDAARRIFDAATAALDGIDILILSASIQIKKHFTDFTRAELDLHYAVNFRSSYELLQLAAPAMCARHWGRILTIGTVQETKPHPLMLPYSCSKHAQTGLVLGLARSLAPDGVTINALAPGVIRTDRNRDALADPDYAQKVRAAIPLARFGEPTDCVGAGLLLCSDAGAYITGQNLFIDGGLGLA